MGERFDLLATDAKEYAIFLVGLGGRLICWNAGAERVFGYQSHEIIGQHFSRFFSAEDILTASPSMNSRRRWRTAGPTVFAGRFARTAPGFGAGRP